MGEGSREGADRVETREEPESSGRRTVGGVRTGLWERGSVRPWHCLCSDFGGGCSAPHFGASTVFVKEGLPMYTPGIADPLSLLPGSHLLVVTEFTFPPSSRAPQCVSA